VYVGFPETAGEPPRQLKDFSKVCVHTGESERVEYDLGYENFQIWCAVEHKWVPVDGDFTIFVGASSRDMRLEGVCTMKDGKLSC